VDNGGDVKEITTIYLYSSSYLHRLGKNLTVWHILDRSEVLGKNSCGFKYSGMWHCVVGQVVPGILKDHNVFIFMPSSTRL